MILLRHGKAEPFSASGSDFDRPLHKHGQEQAEAVAKWLQDQGLKPDCVVSSPALRTLETAKTACRPWPDMPFIFLDSIYEAPPGALIQALEQHTEDTVLLVGHNPGISWCWQMITGDQSAFKTASLGVIEVNQSCINLADGCGKVMMPLQHF